MKPFCVSLGLWSAVKEHTPLGNGQSKQAVTFPACSQAIELREVLVIERGLVPPGPLRNKDFFLPSGRSKCSLKYLWKENQQFCTFQKQAYFRELASFA